MLERIENDIAFCRCPCGAEFQTKLPPPDDDMRQVNESAAGFLVCPACDIAAEDTREREIKELKRQKRFDELLAASDIPPRYQLDAPPIRHVAEWVWRHRNGHILLSGITGTGKTTAACYVAMRLLREGYRVRYCKLRRLLAEWRAARTSDKALEDEKLLYRLGRLDVLIIDEVINKVRVSDSGQELLWEAIDNAISGEWRCRLWLLGNFYTGSLEEIFRDPDTVKRRIRESFAAGVCTQTEVRKIEV